MTPLRKFECTPPTGIKLEPERCVKLCWNNALHEWFQCFHLKHGGDYCYRHTEAHLNDT